MPRLSETHRFLQSSSFGEARPALNCQLSSAFWLAENLKLETEMLRPLPYCDAVYRRDDTKTIKSIINEAFVASSGDIITDYNDLFCLFTHRVALRHVNITMSVFVIWETTSTTVHSSKLAFESWEANSLKNKTYLQSEAPDCPCKVRIAPLYRNKSYLKTNSLCASQHCSYSSRFRK